MCTMDAAQQRRGPMTMHSGQRRSTGEQRWLLSSQNNVHGAIYVKVEVPISAHQVLHLMAHPGA